MKVHTTEWKSKTTVIEISKDEIEAVVIRALTENHHVFLTPPHIDFIVSDMGHLTCVRISAERHYDKNAASTTEDLL